MHILPLVGRATGLNLMGYPWTYISILFYYLFIKKKCPMVNSKSSINCIKRGGNMVAHSLARHARAISDEMYWMKDSPPPAVDALYQEILHMNE